METFYEVMRRQGISRRSFLKYCSLTATSLGLAPSRSCEISLVATKALKRCSMASASANAPAMPPADSLPSVRIDSTEPMDRWTRCDPIGREAFMDYPFKSPCSSAASSAA